LFGGMFGRRKSEGEARTEPAMAAPAPQARATTQVISRPQPEPVRQQAQSSASVDDLFPEHRRDEQFEIPAFLRRQAN